MRSARRQHRGAPPQLHLNYFHYPTGHHEAAWRHPGSDSRRALTLDHHVSAARTVEAACFDSVFLAHTFSLSAPGHTDIGIGQDPVLVLTGMAAHTERIGLIATMSTTFSHPYDLAQRFTTLDQLSGGRAGWNIVTSFGDAAARNFGLDEIPEHDERYHRAAEFVDVCKMLWDSWDDDALRIDKQSGVFADTSGVREIGHRGAYYSVQGPLCLPPSPQRYPMLVQAGSSEAGKDFAARYADAVFTAQPTLEEAREFAADLKARARRLGRPDGSVKVLPGLAPVLGQTEEQARKKEQELTELVMPERGLGILEAYLKVDLSGFPLDGPVPPLPDPSTFSGNASRLQLILELVRREQPTLRQLAARIAGARGHRVVVGTGEQIADSMEEWFREGAADGFNVMPLLLPSGLQEFAREVVPILQERGLFRTEYTATTLRGHYGASLSPISMSLA